MAHQPSAPTFEDWSRSDHYHNSYLLKPDTGLSYTLENSTKSGLPEIAVSEAQGKFLHLLARTINAKRVLEVGTLGGYVQVWIPYIRLTKCILGILRSGLRKPFQRAVKSSRSILTSFTLRFVTHSLFLRNVIELHSRLQRRISPILD
jgi:hypothetical protein